MGTSSPLLQRNARSRGRATRLAPALSASLLAASLATSPARAQGIAGAIWVDQFGSPLHDYAGAVAVHESDVYLTSHSPKGPALLRKYTASGDLVWQADVSAGNSSPVALCADVSRVCVGGAARQPLAGDDEPIDGLAGYVRCFDPGGAVLWTRYIRATVRGFEPQTRVHVLAMGADGILVSGSTTGTLADCSPQSCAQAGGSGVFFQKYGAADGTLIWTRQLGSPGHDLPLGATVDSSGEAEVWEVEYRTFQGEPFFDSSVRLRHLDADGAVRKAAEIPWGAGPMPTAATLAGTAFYVAAPDASATDVTLRAYDWDAKHGRLEPTPWTISIPDAQIYAMRAGPSSLHVVGTMPPRLPGQVGTDAFVRRYQVDSPTEVWTIRFGTPGNDEASSVAVDSSRIYVAGYTEGAVEPGGHLGGTDAYVARFAELFHAEAGGPYAVDEGSTVALSASATGVDYGQALSYAWDLDGDEIFEEAGQRVVYEPADDTDEPVTVRVQVTDEYSQGTAVAEASITIANVAPTVDAGPDVVLAAGQGLDRSVVFTDPGADTWSATADYGDGSVAASLPLSATSFTLDHVYGSPGIYTVTVTVADEDGGTGADSFVVVVTGDTVTIADIIGAVEALVEQDVLSPGQGHSLVVKLEAAQAALDAADPTRAVESLTAFTHEVNALENAQILDSIQAGNLVHMAEDVIASISG